MGQHSLGLNDIAFIRDDRIITASDDKSIVLWSVEDCKVISKLSGHTGFVSCLAVNPKSDLIVSGGHDNQIRMWDVRSVISMRQLYS